MAYIERKAYKRKEEGNYKLAARKRVYNTVRWRNFRKWKLQATPLCELCAERGEVAPATEVHHKVSFLTAMDAAAQYALAFDANNLQSLCKSCHSKLHNNKAFQER